MGQRKGQTGNPNGRPRGVPNKVTGTIKDWIAQLIDKNRGRMEKDIEALEPKERLQMLEKLMQYVVPKQQAVSANVDFNKLSDNELDMIIDSLTKNIDDDEKDSDTER